MRVIVHPLTAKTAAAKTVDARCLRKPLEPVPHIFLPDTRNSIITALPVNTEGGNAAPLLSGRSYSPGSREREEWWVIEWNSFIHVCVCCG